jgi:hypothetical protein
MGPIPSELEGGRTREKLDLSENEFTGQIPERPRADVADLRMMFLRDNLLTGPIPARSVVLTESTF